MTVFIEYVLIDNFVIDYMILKATFLITGFPCSKGRLFLCAFLGSLFALFYPMLKIGTILLTVIKILFGMLLVLLAVKKISLKRYYVTALIFILLTFLTGGAIIGLSSIFGVSLGSEFLISTIIFIVALTMKLLTKIIKYVYRQKNVKAFTYRVGIEIGANKIDCVGFLDTGNGLYDGESPVIVCDKKFIKNFNLDVKALKNIKELDFQTVDGKSRMISLKTDKVLIYNGDKLNIFNNVTLCVAKGGVGTGYDVILHPELLEDRYDNSTNQQTEKVS